MAKTANTKDLGEMLEQVQAQLAALAERVEKLESLAAPPRPDGGKAGTPDSATTGYRRRGDGGHIGRPGRLPGRAPTRPAHPADRLAGVGATGTRQHPGVPHILTIEEAA